MLWCFCRAMLCISAAYAVMRCLSVYVCLSVTFANSVETSNRIVRLFSPSSRPIIRSSAPNGMAIFRRVPPNGTLNAGGVGRKSRLWAYICLLLTLQQTGVVNTVAGEPRPPFRKLWHTSGSKRGVLIAGEDEMFMTRSLNVTPKTTEQRI